jgi:hypothetical protein
MLNEITPNKAKPPIHSNRLRKKLRKAYINENNPYSDINFSKRSDTP